MIEHGFQYVKTTRGNMVEGNDIFSTAVQALKIERFVNTPMDMKALVGNFQSFTLSSLSITAFHLLLEVT